MSSNKFVSCIRVHGCPILPPLITPERRLELQEDRFHALQVEERLKKRKEVEISQGEETLPIFNNDSSHNSSGSELNDSTAQLMQFVKKALEEVSHNVEIQQIQAQILEELKRVNDHSFMMNEPASSDTLDNLESLSLNDDSKSIIDNTTMQFEDLSLNMENNAVDEAVTELENLSLSPDQTVYEMLPPGENNTTDASAISSDSVSVRSSPPAPVEDTSPQGARLTTPTSSKLVRSNSYTLESPSPSVLKYLKSISGDKEVTEMVSDYIEWSTKRKTASKNLNECWGEPEQKTDQITPNDHTGSMPHKGDSSSMEGVENLAYSSDSEKDDMNNSVTPLDNRSNYLIVPLDNKINISNNSSPGNKNSIISSGVEKLDEKPLPCQTRNVPPQTIERAAVIIQAAIRGYLTKRLFNSFKVVELKNTIKESLIYALSLHSEHNIKPADHTLYTRLLRQVTAACYEFHSIFFETSIHDKMKIIQLDRAIKKRELKGPRLSASNRIRRKSDPKKRLSSPMFSSSSSSVASPRSRSTPRKINGETHDRPSFKPWR